uniref:hypothetical protein n=1 Tax=uncultured Altererythrobacter sp. TaxID=500840 RepID=UPI00262CA7DA|nr:hypothetical protein [uncultured Altererythrobacter sp.]
MSGLAERIAAKSAAEVQPAIAEFAARLAVEAGALAVLFYGSNLRTGSLEGVLDYYVLLPGEQQEKIWPRVSYREWTYQGETLRAKIATMSLAQFGKAASGQSRDTTIWARFVQPSALIWVHDDDARAQTLDALCDAAKTAARLAVALGPENGTADEYWRQLFRATYKAEFRVEKAGREDSILSVNAEHFDGLLPLALAAQGLPFTEGGGQLQPKLSDQDRRKTLSWWSGRQRLGKPLNILRLLKASTTFDGAARYAAWKVERHTGVPIEVTPWREKHPVLAAPGVLFKVWRERKKQQG